MPVPPHLLRLEAYAVSHEAVRATVRALGQSRIAAFSTAEAILVDALAGPERNDDELHLIDVLSSSDDAAIQRLMPKLHGMRRFALTLAQYREEERKAARRLFLSRFRRRP